MSKFTQLKLDRGLLKKAMPTTGYAYAYLKILGGQSKSQVYVGVE